MRAKAWSYIKAYISGNTVCHDLRVTDSLFMGAAAVHEASAGIHVQLVEQPTT
jgi:hypothetical protein